MKGRTPSERDLYDQGRRFGMVIGGGLLTLILIIVLLILIF